MSSSDDLDALLSFDIRGRGRQQQQQRQRPIYQQQQQPQSRNNNNVVLLLSSSGDESNGVRGGRQASASGSASASSFAARFDSGPLVSLSSSDTEADIPASNIVGGRPSPAVGGRPDSLNSSLNGDFDDEEAAFQEALRRSAQLHELERAQSGSGAFLSDAEGDAAVSPVPYDQPDIRESTPASASSRMSFGSDFRIELSFGCSSSDEHDASPVQRSQKRPSPNDGESSAPSSASPIKRARHSVAATPSDPVSFPPTKYSPVTRLRHMLEPDTDSIDLTSPISRAATSHQLAPSSASAASSYQVPPSSASVVSSSTARATVPAACDCAHVSSGTGTHCILHSMGIQSQNRRAQATGKTTYVRLPPHPADAVVLDDRTLLEMVQHACSSAQRDEITDKDLKKWLTKPSLKDKASLITLLVDQQFLNSGNGVLGATVLSALQSQRESDATFKHLQIKTMPTNVMPHDSLRDAYVSTFVWTRSITSSAMEESQNSQSVLQTGDDQRQTTACCKYRSAVLFKYEREQADRRRLRDRDQKGAASEATPARFLPARIAPQIARIASDPTEAQVVEPFVVRRVDMAEFVQLHDDGRLPSFLKFLADTAQTIAGVPGSFGSEGNAVAAPILSHHHLFKAFLIVEDHRAWLSARSKASNEALRLGHGPVAQHRLCSRTGLQQYVVELQLQHGVQISFFDSPDSTAKFISDLTRAIVEYPYRAEDEFSSFHASTAKKQQKGRSFLQKADLARWNKKTHEIFFQMLRQITHVGPAAAISIALKFETPAALLRAYSKPGLTDKAKSEILQDMQCYAVQNGTIAADRRGPQRIGPKASQRIFAFFTCAEERSEVRMSDI